MNQIKLLLLCGFLFVSAGGFGQAKKSPTPAQGINNQFSSLNQRILEMAKDFPEDKYNYKPNPEVRSFGEVIVHIFSGNVYASKAGHGEKASWDELDPKNYKTKAAVVEGLEKSINDATATLKAVPHARFATTLSPWLSVIEHSAEHYGQLVVYYRLNGLVPPASRPQPSK